MVASPASSSDCFNPIKCTKQDMLILRHYYTADLVPALQTENSEILLNKSQTVNLALSPEVYCLGFTRNGKRHPCAKKSVGKKQCLSCSKEDDFLVCLKCDGATCLQFTDELKKDCQESDYSVYLASFGDKVKAGISKTARLHKRWVEQGADFAARTFGSLDGLQARVIESALVRSGLLSRLTLKEKMELPAPNESSLSEELESESFQRVAQMFEKNAVMSSVESLQNHYPDSSSVRPTQFLQGTILGAKGPVLFLDQNGQKKAFGLPNAVGRKILTNTLSAFS